MHDLQPLLALILLSGQIEEEISRPAEDLVDDVVPESNNWGVLCQFCELDHVRLGFFSEICFDPGLSGVRNERGVLVNVSSCLVVLGVGNAPGMERDEEERMHDQAHGVVELLVLGESTMAALVCQNPDAGKDEALDGGVCSPGCESKVDIWEQGDVCHGEVDEGREVEVIADNVCHGAEDRGLEAMRRNCIVDLLHGEGRQLELIAIEIEVFGFFGSHGCWSHCIVNGGKKENRRDLRLEALALRLHFAGAVQFIFLNPFRTRTTPRGLTSLPSPRRGLKRAIYIWPLSHRARLARA